MVTMMLLLLLTLGRAMELLQLVVYHGIVWYMAQLRSCPLATKSLTTGVIGIFGDYLAQWLEYRLAVARAVSQGAHEPVKGTPASWFSNMLSVHGRYDVRRGLSTLAERVFLSGPLLHWGYDWFETMLPIHETNCDCCQSTCQIRSNATGQFLATLVHVLGDSILLDSIFIGVTIVVADLFEGYTRKELLAHFKSDYVVVLKMGWTTSLTLLPLQFVCIRFLPITLRVLGINCIDLIWDTAVSFSVYRSQRNGRNQRGRNRGQTLKEVSKLMPLRDLKATFGGRYKEA